MKSIEVNAPKKTVKKTRQSGNPSFVKTSSMNKHQKRSYKAYRRQGR